MNGSQSIHSYFETIPKNDGKNDPIRPEMQKKFFKHDENEVPKKIVFFFLFGR